MNQICKFRVENIRLFH